jgi:hypothetical protein
MKNFLFCANNSIESFSWKNNFKKINLIIGFHRLKVLFVVFAGRLDYANHSGNTLIFYGEKVIRVLILH